MTTIEESARTLSKEELDALPVLSIIRSTGINPHAWQKRLDATPTGRTFLWFVTSDEDWGETTAALLSEQEAFVLLWEPQP